MGITSQQGVDKQSGMGLGQTDGVGTGIAWLAMGWGWWPWGWGYASEMGVNFFTVSFFSENPLL